MAVETHVLAGHSSSGELVRSIDWKGAFWVASGVPALVLFSIGGMPVRPENSHFWFGRCPWLRASSSLSPTRK